MGERQEGTRPGHQGKGAHFLSVLIGQGDDVRGGGVARNIVRRHLRKHRFADQPHAWRGRLRVGFDDPKLSLFGRERGQRRLRGGTGGGRRGGGPSTEERRVGEGGCR